MFSANQYLKKSRAEEKSMGSSDDGILVVKRDVKYQLAANKDKVSVFRILPAIDPNNQDLATSWLPSVRKDGTLTDWGLTFAASRFTGHPGARKMDIVSIQGYDKFSGGRECPLISLYKYIRNHNDDWGYLIERTGARAPIFEYPKVLMAVNAINADSPQDGAIVTVLHKPLIDGLIYGENSIVYQANPSPDIGNLIKQNYMNAYVYGDITHPETGLVFQVKRGEGPGVQGAYQILPYKGPNGVIQRARISPDLLKSRYDFNNPLDILNIRTYDDILVALASVLNKTSPSGVHEHDLLRAAFPESAGVIQHQPKPSETATLSMQPAQELQAKQAQNAPKATMSFDTNTSASVDFNNPAESVDIPTIPGDDLDADFLEFKQSMSDEDIPF